MHRLVELDGLRGLACLSVLIAHYFGEVPHGFRFFALGWTGVDLFFCLSGFLIGGILLDNRDSPSYFSTFYIRRGFRIFPVYYMTISLVLIAIAWGQVNHPSWIDSALPSVAYYTYSQNIILALVGDHATAWLMPTWTLCVEEQFYLLLPVIIYLIPGNKFLKALFLLITCASLFRLLLLLLRADDMALHVLLPSRWDLLLLGVLAACLYRKQGVWEKLISQNSRLLKWGVSSGAVGVVALVLIDKHFDLKSFDVVGSLFVGICCISFLLLVISGTVEGTRFRSRILCHFGTISYGLYLVHQPIAGLLHGFLLEGRPDVATTPQILVTLGALILSIIVASISWKFFERPLVELGHRWRYGRVERPARSPVSMA